jgi:periplasmic protein TonB
MFNNLIESSSHRSEFKRRGSFVFFTTVGYALFFAIAGVVSIYAYDARMTDQSLEIVTLLPPVEFVAPPNTTPNQPANPPRRERNQQPVDQRQELIASINHPELTPPEISTTPNRIPPARDNILTLVGSSNINSDIGGVPQPGATNSGSLTQNRGPVVTDLAVPPPALETRPIPEVVRKRVINSEALSLPKPRYPTLAKQMGIQGTVSIQVLIDETGKVVSAKPLSGSPLLTTEAQKAAYKAEFSPTFVGDQAVKVSGVITYNFILQR